MVQKTSRFVLLQACDIPGNVFCIIPTPSTEPEQVCTPMASPVRCSQIATL